MILSVFITVQLIFIQSLIIALKLKCFLVLGVRLKDRFGFFCIAVITTANSPQTWRFSCDWATNFPIFGHDNLTALLNVHVCLQDDIVVDRMKCVCVL